MAASTAARSMASFFTIALIGISSLASAQSVSPSNATLPASESGSETVLRLVGGPIFSQTNYNIAPLTTPAGKGGTATAVAVSISTGPPFPRACLVLQNANQTSLRQSTSKEFSNWQTIRTLGTSRVVISPSSAAIQMARISILPTWSELPEMQNLKPLCYTVKQLGSAISRDSIISQPCIR
jgi:hypothetical protein